MLKGAAASSRPGAAFFACGVAETATWVAKKGPRQGGGWTASSDETHDSEEAALHSF